MQLVIFFYFHHFIKDNSFSFDNSYCQYMLKNTRFQPLKNACLYTYIPFERKRLTERVRVLKTHFALFASVFLHVPFSCPVVLFAFSACTRPSSALFIMCPHLYIIVSSSAILHVSPSPTNSTLREKYTHEKKC